MHHDWLVSGCVGWAAVVNDAVVWGCVENAVVVEAGAGAVAWKCEVRDPGM